MFSIKEIKLSNFRNYGDFKINDLHKVNIFVGPNAVGKTNLMEAISLVTQLASFRHPVLADMLPFACGDGDCFAQIDVYFDDGYTLSACISADGKKYKFNDKNKSMGELRGRYPAVVFTPDDLMLVKGGNSLRRNALDTLGSQISQNYYTVVRDYNRILRQKRECLRDGADKNTLTAINSVMALPAAQLICYRFALCEAISSILSDMYANIADSDEKLQLVYKSKFLEDEDGGNKSGNLNSPDRDNLQHKIADNLDKLADQEIAIGRPLSGPHKDELNFVLQARNAADFASQGQQRSIVLAWKLAEVKMVHERLGKTPILLLDDVMSELDRDRRHALLNTLSNNSQVFITTTNLDYFESKFLEDAKVVNLANLTR